MRRISPFIHRHNFFTRKLSSSSTSSSSFIERFKDRLSSRETWKKAWQYFLWVPAIIFINDHVVSISPVNGISMRPTLNPDTNYGKRDWVLLYKFLLKPSRGDIVVLKSPTDPKSWVIKRIIAIEGDVVETRPTYPERKIVVPQNHVWVEGDEAFHSKDSNSYGPVTKLLLVGKVEYVLWPRPRIVQQNGFTHDRVIFSTSPLSQQFNDDRPDNSVNSLISK